MEQKLQTRPIYNPRCHFVLLPTMEIVFLVHNVKKQKRIIDVDPLQVLKAALLLFSVSE